MLKLAPDDAKLFEDIMADAAAIQAKHKAFSAVIHDEHKALEVRSRTLWENVKAKYGLEGELRYSDGKLYPLGLGPDGAPIMPADAKPASPEPVTAGNDVPALDARKVN